MGVLDSGTRWMDIVLTSEGKRALSEGDLDVRWFSLSDGGSAYLVGGHDGTDRWLQDPSTHVMLEAYSSPQDTSTIVTDERGVVRRDESFARCSEECTDEERLKRTIELWAANLNSVPLIKSDSDKQPAIQRASRFIESPETIVAAVESTVWEQVVPRRVSQEPPVWRDDEFTAQPQMRFLPPITDSGEESRPLGEWQPEFPIPSPITDDDLTSIADSFPSIAEWELNDGSGTFRFLLGLQGEMKPLMAIEQPVDIRDVRVWSVGELLKVSGETHFVRLLLLVLDRSVDNE